MIPSSGFREKVQNVFIDLNSSLHRLEEYMCCHLVSSIGNYIYKESKYIYLLSSVITLSLLFKNQAMIHTN